MTLSREQLILAEMLARLNGPALGDVVKPTGLVYDRSRLRSLGPTQLPAGSIYPMEGTTQRKNAVGESVLLTKIVLWEEGTAGTPMDAAMDPIWQWTHQQLMSDESLGGLSIRIEPVQKVWGFNLAQSPFGDLDLHYAVTYRHNLTNPSLP